MNRFTNKWMTCFIVPWLYGYFPHWSESILRGGVILVLLGRSFYRGIYTYFSGCGFWRSLNDKSWIFKKMKHYQLFCMLFPYLLRSCQVVELPLPPTVHLARGKDIARIFFTSFRKLQFTSRRFWRKYANQKCCSIRNHKHISYAKNKITLKCRRDSWDK